MSSETHQPTGLSCHSCLLREKKTDSVKKSTSLRRRDFLGGLGALALAPNAVAAMAAQSPISVTAINHAKIRVTDPARSLEWYQSLFGLPIVARQGTTVILRIGEGPQFLAIDGESSRKPGIVHMGLSVDSFDANQVLQTLKTNDQLGPIKARIHTRGPELGGDPSGTPELFLEDPDGITVQLQDTSYCGGGGKLGDKCSAKPKPSRKKGLLNLRDYNHFTVFVERPDSNGRILSTTVSNADRHVSGRNATVYAWDQAISFSPLSVLAGRGTFRPFIHHVCFTVNEFNPEKVLGALADFGVKRRDTTRGPVKPLQSYVTMRMPNRGGAPKGTPELYFTDPDGIRLQIQDVRYSGGSGYLGDQRGTASSHPGGQR